MLWRTFLEQFISETQQSSSQDDLDKLTLTIFCDWIVKDSTVSNSSERLAGTSEVLIALCVSIKTSLSQENDVCKKLVDNIHLYSLVLKDKSEELVSVIDEKDQIHQKSEFRRHLFRLLDYLKRLD